MWTGKRVGLLLSACLLLSCFLPQALCADVTLTDAEVTEIPELLRDTKAKALSLRLSLETQQRISAEQSEKLKAAELRLRTAEQRLREAEASLSEAVLKSERSEASLINCLSNLDETQEMLSILKADYLALSQSLTRQKHAMRAWRAAALISGGLAVGLGGYAWWRAGR